MYVHIRRYLEELVQNVRNIDWPLMMQELLSRIYKTREIIKKMVFIHSLKNK